MRKLPSRQVHLDFHTSGFIPAVGSEFNKRQFQQALIEGNVNSITVFAKCCHGYCYFPTRFGTEHPTKAKGFDLTGAMINAAHEINVDAPVYITVGWSALDAEKHPEWAMYDHKGLACYHNTNPNAGSDDERPDCSWMHLCPSGDYAEHIYSLTREICNRYEKLDGLFYDIVYLGDTCYCPNCMKGMLAEGFDPDNIEDARKYYRRMHLRFMNNCTSILREKHPDATIFFNSGGAEIYRQEYHNGQTHFEMENLPNTWDGYNYIPLRANFLSKYGKELVGMTGKFHTDWGEFGSYKNPNALRYEALLLAMFGAKISVGDQMLPSGKLDIETYKIIGKAYRALAAVEDYCFPAASTATLAAYSSGVWSSDQGLCNMLLEAHIDFDIIDNLDCISKYRCLVLPDSVKLTENEAVLLRKYTENGGAIIMSGTSALGGNGFMLDCGAEYVGTANYKQDYFKPSTRIKLPFGNAPFLCYEAGLRSIATDGTVLAEIYEPWFDRTYATYCSHKNTPYRDEPALHPAAVKKGSIVWFAHPLFRMYHKWGAQLHREAFLAALRLVYKPVYEISHLPTQGRTRLTTQRSKSRYVFHVAYASPIKRGEVFVIEDLPKIHGVLVRVYISEVVKSVRVVPSGKALAFTYEDGKLSFRLPSFCCHTAVEITF